MGTLVSIRVFCTVAELKSFTAAAERLGLSTAMTSKHVMRLEERLGPTKRWSDIGLTTLRRVVVAVKRPWERNGTTPLRLHTCDVRFVSCVTRRESRSSPAQ
jgi:Bacterial regulatory helix-turn-helix protein, lysR family